MASSLERRLKALEAARSPSSDKWRQAAIRGGYLADWEALEQEKRNTREFNAAWLIAQAVLLDEEAERAEAAGDHERAAALRDPNHPGRHELQVPNRAEWDDDFRAAYEQSWELAGEMLRAERALSDLTVPPAPSDGIPTVPRALPKIADDVAT